MRGLKLAFAVLFLVMAAYLRVGVAGELQLVARIGGRINAVNVREDLAYMGMGAQLVILDVSDPYQPKVIGQTKPLIEEYKADAPVRNIALHNDYAYIICLGELIVIDVSDPTTPVVVNHTTYEASAFGIAGNYGYLVKGRSLKILDITDPTELKEVGSCELERAGVAIALSPDGKWAYVAAEGYGLRIVDVSDPQNPKEVGFYDTANALDVTCAGDLVYMADGGMGLRIIEVSDPYHPVEVGWLDTSNARGLTVLGRYVYLADGLAGLRIIDVVDPTDPLEVGNIDLDVYALDVVVVDGRAYVVSGNEGELDVIDVSSSTDPTLISRYSVPISARSIALGWNYVYVAGNHGWHVIDISDPARPVTVGSNKLGSIWDIEVSNDYAWVVSYYDGLHVFDITNPCVPVQVGNYNPSGYQTGIKISGNYAYLASYSAGIHVLDVSDPHNPVEVGHCDTPGYAYDVALAGNYAYVADGHMGLRILDVSDPTDPREVGCHDTPGEAIHVAIAGDYAYVADKSGLRIVNVADPTSPFGVGAYEEYNVYDVAVSGDYAFVGSYKALRVLDISDPTNPVEIDWYPLETSAREVAVSGQYIFVAAGALYIFRYTPGVTQVRFVPVYPTTDVEPSEVMEGGRFYRYYRLVDQDGNPVAGAVVHFTAVGDNQTVTSDSTGLVRLMGEAEKLGPSGTYTGVDLVDRVTDVTGDEIEVANEPRFDVIVHPMEPITIKYSLVATATVEAGLGLGAGLGVGVDIASIGATAGSGFVISMEVTEGTLTFSPEVNSQLGGKLHFGPKLDCGVVSVEGGVGVQVTGLGTGGWTMEFHLPLEGEEAMAFAAYLLEPLINSGVLFFPGIAPLYSAMLQHWHPDLPTVSVWSGIGARAKVSAGWQVDLNCSFGGTDTGGNSLTIPVRLAGASMGTEVGFMARRYLISTSPTSFRTRIELGLSGKNLFEVGLAMGLHGWGANKRAAFSIATEADESGDLSSLSLCMEHFSFNSFANDEHRIEGQKSVITYTGQSAKEAFDVLPQALRPFVDPARDVWPLVLLSEEAMRELGNALREGEDSILPYLEGGRELFEIQGEEYKFGLHVKFKLGLGGVIDFGVGGSLGVLSYGEVLLRHDELEKGQGRFYTVEEYPPRDVPLIRDFLSSLWGKVLDALSTIAAQVYQVAQEAVETAGEVIVETGEAIIEGGKRLIADGAKLIDEGIKTIGLVRIPLLSSMEESKALKLLSVMPSEVAASLYLQSKVYANIITVGDAVAVNAFDEEGNSITDLPPCTLVMGYTDDQLAAVGLGPTEVSNLRIYRWDDKAKKWEYVGGTVNPAEHSVTATIEKAGIYTIGVGSCSSQASTVTEDGWHMVALPGELCPPCVYDGCGDVTCALCDDLDPCYIFYYDPDQGSYVMAPPKESICYHAGMGFWVRTYEPDVQVCVDVQVPTQDVAVPLKDAWNMIGNPFPFDVAVSGLRVRHGGQELPLLDAQAQGWVSAYLFAYDPESGSYEMLDPEAGTLQAWHGYWIRAYVECELIVPAQPAPPRPAGAGR